MNRIEPNIMTFIVYGLLYDLMLNLYKPFATKFLTRLGGSSFHISLFNSLPGLIAVFTLLPGALFISRFKDKKKITAIFFGISRSFLLFILLVPFLPPEIKPLLFVVLIGLMNLPDAISQSSFQSYLGEVFNGRNRGRAISLRSKFGNITVLLVTLLTGLIISYIPKSNEQTIIVYQLFYLLAFIVGIFEIRVFLKFTVKENNGQTLNKKEDRANLKDVADALHDKKFIRFLLCCIIFYITWHVGWPLGAVIQIIDMGANEIWLAAYAVLNGIVAFFAASRWNKQITKRGNNFALTLSAFFVALNALVIALAPNNLIMLFTFIIGGIASTGANMTLLNGLLGVSPDKNRIVYISVFYTFTNISLAIMPFVSHYFVTQFGSRNAMLIVSSGRFASAILMFFVFIVRAKTKEKAQ